MGKERSCDHVKRKALKILGILPLMMRFAGGVSIGIGLAELGNNFASISSQEPAKPLSEMWLGNKVRLIGWSHTHPNFFAHKETLAALIDKSSVVGLEYFSPTDQQFFRQARSSNPKSLSLRESIAFAWGGLMEICWQANKLVIALNPETPATQIWEIGVLTGLPPAGLPLLKNQLKELKEQWGQPLSRRQFLRVAATGIMNLPWIAAWQTWGQLLMEKNSSNTTITRWNLIDWRDAAVALRLRRLIARLKEQELAVYITGRGHLGGIFYYYHHPKIAEAKLFLYPHQFLSQPLRCYKPTKEGWSPVLLPNW